jgi:hypothetical protein
MSDVLQDLHELVTERGGDSTIDIITTQPNDWPRDYSPRVCRNDKIRNALFWFATRPETQIAVVCHYNVIRTLLMGDSLTIQAPSSVRPQNALPICAELVVDDEGQLGLRLAENS